MSTTHEKTVKLNDRSAFHMRPCQQMVAIAKVFKGCEKIELLYGDRTFSVNSIVDLMEWAGVQVQDTSPEAGTVTIRAAGTDARMAVEILTTYLTLLES